MENCFAKQLIQRLNAVAEKDYERIPTQKTHEVDPIFGQSHKSLTPDTAFAATRLPDVINNACFLDDTDSICVLDHSDVEDLVSDSLNPFLGVQGKNENSPLPSVFSQTKSTPSFSEHGKSRLKMNEWLEMTDREYVDSVLLPNTAENLETSLSVGRPRSGTVLKNYFLTPAASRIRNCSQPDATPCQNKNYESLNSAPPKRNFFARLFGFGSRSSKSQSSTEYCSRKIKRAVSSHVPQFKETADPNFYFVYYLHDDPFPFRSLIPPTHKFTLKDAKAIIPGVKRKKYRFFFKNTITSEGIEQIIFDEISNNDSECPILNCEIVCKVFKV